MCRARWAVTILYGIVADRSRKRRNSEGPNFDQRPKLGLIAQTPIIVEAPEVELIKDDAAWLGVPWDESASQRPLEAWAVAVATRRWAIKLQNNGAASERQHCGAGNGAKAGVAFPVVNWVGGTRNSRLAEPSS